MSETKRALSLRQAKENGLVTGDYEYKNLPNEFIGILEFKVWGESQNLKLFLRTDDGNAYVVSVFSNKKLPPDRKYAPKNMPDLDMSDANIQPGMTLRVITEKNRNGNINFLEAYILESKK